MRRGSHVQAEFQNPGQSTRLRERGGQGPGNPEGKQAGPAPKSPQRPGTGVSATEPPQAQGNEAVCSTFLLSCPGVVGEPGSPSSRDTGSSQGSVSAAPPPAPSTALGAVCTAHPSERGEQEGVGPHAPFVEPTLTLTPTREQEAGSPGPTRAEAAGAPERRGGRAQHGVRRTHPGSQPSAQPAASSAWRGHSPGGGHLAPRPSCVLRAGG